MQIDWFTLVAQIVNFVILLYLLQRFLYGPIVNAMDRREQKIAARLQEAEEKRSEADKEAERYHQRRRELEEEHEKRMKEIQDEIEERRKELLEAAHQEVQEQKREWREALKQEQDSFLKQLRQRVGQQALELARHALEELADTEVERHMADKFVTRLQEMESDAKAEITESFQKSGSEVVIRSAFELPDELREKISSTVQNQFLDGQELDARFETSSDMIAGIEMQVDSHRVAWIIRDYLAGLEEQIRETIRQETGEQAEAENGA